MTRPVAVSSCTVDVTGTTTDLRANKSAKLSALTMTTKLQDTL